MSTASVGVVDSEYAAVAEACKAQAIPFLGIFGVAEIAGPDPINAALARAAPTLRPEDAERMRAILTGGQKSQLNSVDREAYEACCSDSLAKLQELQINLKRAIISDLGHNAVHVASRYGSMRVLRYVVGELKMDVNVPSEISGKRALHYAVQHAHVEAVEFLLKSGADPTLVDHQGFNPMQGICPPQTQKFDVSVLDGRFRAALPKICALMPKGLIPTPIVDALAPKPDKSEPTAAAQVNQKSEDAKKETAPSSSKQNENEPPVCVICFTAPADTMVLPCEHCIVCRGCSIALRKTPDARICVSCRCKIQHILE